MYNKSNDCIIRVQDNNICVVFPDFESKLGFTCLN